MPMRFSDKLHKPRTRINSVQGSGSGQEFDESESFDSYIEKIVRKKNLSPEEASIAMRILMSDKVSEYQQGEFLTAMAMKEPTAEELASFAYTLRKLAEPMELKGIKARTALVDTCGTGGGTLETFNVSTTIMFILAAAGIIIAKHGNKAITSKCGSADVLEKLGVNINLKPQEVAECISKIGIGFIFAPNFHKAFKNVQKIRKKLPFPTIFNVLGPLANPTFSLENTKTEYSQVLGVNKPELTEKVAEVLKYLQVKRAIVVHGFNGMDEKGMDELSTVGKTKVSELKADGHIDNYFLEPEEFELKRANPKDLLGGAPSVNAKILVDILRGKDKGPKRDIVLLNAAAGLYVGGKAKDIKDGIKLAEQKIDSLAAYKKLEDLISFSKNS